jgi:hypothetical protein
MALRPAAFIAARASAGGEVKSFSGVLVALAVVAVLVGLYWIRKKLLSGAGAKRSKREFHAREAERDRQAVRVATKSRSVGDSAPRDGFAIPAGAARDGAPGAQTLGREAESRRRASTSTSFDPDLPSS